MQKAIALLTQDPSLQEISKEIDQLDEHHQQRMDFLRKSAKTAVENHEKAKEPLLEKIQQYLIDKKLLVDFDPKTQHLHIDSNTGVIMLCDGDEHKGHPIEMLMRSFGFQPQDDH